MYNDSITLVPPAGTVFFMLYYFLAGMLQRHMGQRYTPRRFSWVHKAAALDLISVTGPPIVHRPQLKECSWNYKKKNVY